MISGSNTAVGIDISDKRISLALLRKSRKRIELLRAVDSPTPEGAVKDGNISNPAAIAKAIKQLKRKVRARSVRTAVSLFAKPVLLQIMDMPKGLPTNIRQFVFNEIKQCVVLPGKKVAFDYCGIDVSKKVSDTRLFVVGAEGQNLSDVARSYNQMALNVEAVEPALPACTRAIYEKKVAVKFDCNVLVVLLHNGVLNLCVFRNQLIDFVRTKALGEEKTEPEALCQRLVKEINEVIQFYGFEVADSSDKWEITVIADTAGLPEDALERMKAEVTCDDMQVRNRRNVLLDTVIVDKSNGGEVSLVAVGLAMRLLDVKDHNLRVNLFPREATEVKSLRRDFLITANIMAAVVLIMILMTGGLIFPIRKANLEVIRKVRTDRLRHTYRMIWEQGMINWRMKQLSDRPTGLTGLLGLQQEVGWPSFLKDIRAATPKTVRITNLSGRAKTRVTLEGLALSYESIHLFVSMLNKSQHIKEASLAGTEKRDETQSFVKYAISCLLTQKEKQ